MTATETTWNPVHLEVALNGKDAIAEYRRSQPDVELNLRGADLNNAMLWEANLHHTDFRDANLFAAKLNYANLNGANFANANLRQAYLTGAAVRGANFSGADLDRACLVSADLERATFDRSNLANSLMHGARLIETIFSNSNLTGSTVYGVGVWDVEIDNETRQESLRITPNESPVVTVDNIKVAQFVYLLLNNPEIRDVLETVTSKVVLILGRFTPQRKTILDAIRDELRKLGFVPVMFDFENTAARTFTETITTLARLSRFVVADITDAKSIPQELMAIVPHLPSVPIQPLILAGQREYGMFESFRPYPWVLPTHEYHDNDELIRDLVNSVIQPAQDAATALRGKNAG